MPLCDSASEDIRCSGPAWPGLTVQYHPTASHGQVEPLCQRYAVLDHSDIPSLLDYSLSFFDSRVTICTSASWIRGTKHYHINNILFSPLRRENAGTTALGKLGAESRNCPYFDPAPTHPDCGRRFPPFFSNGFSDKN